MKLALEKQKILVTGGTGFLGRHIVKRLSERGIIVTTLGRSSNADIICDICSTPDLGHFQFDTVVHTAGKAHIVPKNAQEATAFFQHNLNGTKNLCTALERSITLPSAFIFISTVAVYGKEYGELINEQHPLQGQTPYAQSKIQAEAYLQEWCQKSNIKLSILRLPLVIGSSAPGNLGKMVEAIRRHRFFYFSGPSPRKSVVLATDVAGIIPEIANFPGIYNLTDGYHPTIRQIGAKIAKELRVRPALTLPSWPFRILGIIGDRLGGIIPFNSDIYKKVTSSLTFDDSHARTTFNWSPSPAINTNFTEN